MVERTPQDIGELSGVHLLVVPPPRLLVEILVVFFLNEPLLLFVDRVLEVQERFYLVLVDLVVLNSYVVVTEVEKLVDLSVLKHLVELRRFAVSYHFLLSLSEFAFDDVVSQVFDLPHVPPEVLVTVFGAFDVLHSLRNVFILLNISLLELLNLFQLLLLCKNIFPVVAKDLSHLLPKDEVFEIVESLPVMLLVLVQFLVVFHLLRPLAVLWLFVNLFIRLLTILLVLFNNNFFEHIDFLEINLIGFQRIHEFTFLFFQLG